MKNKDNKYKNVIFLVDVLTKSNASDITTFHIFVKFLS